MTDLPGFLLASLALTGSPGPAVLSMAACGAAFGLRRSVGYMAGLVAGMVIVISAVASGVTGLLLAVEGAAPVAAALAAAYIVYLAWRIATAPPPPDLSAAGSPPDAQGDATRAPSFAGGVFLQLVNPKAYAAMTALYSGFLLLPDRPLVDALLKGALLIAMIVSVNLVWGLIGAALTRIAHRPGVHRAINLGFAALLVASVAFALLL